MTLEWITSWWNLVFIVPFLLALLYLGLYTASGITFGEPDADADFDADADADVDADADGEMGVDADHDADLGAEGDFDADADADVDADHDHDADHAGGSALGQALTWLGVGRVPVSLLVMVLLMVWGAAGFIFNYLAILWPGLPQNAAMAGISLPAAGLLSILATRGVSRLIVRFMPLDAAHVIRRHELLGLVGEAILPIDKQVGLAALRDSDGDLHQIPCRRHGDGPAIDKGAKVKLVAYNGKQKLYYVVPQIQAGTNDPAGSSNRGDA